MMVGEFYNKIILRKKSVNNTFYITLFKLLQRIWSRDLNILEKKINLGYLLFFLKKNILL